MMRLLLHIHSRRASWRISTPSIYAIAPGFIPTTTEIREQLSLWCTQTDLDLNEIYDWWIRGVCFFDCTGPYLWELFVLLVMPSSLRLCANPRRLVGRNVRMLWILWLMMDTAICDFLTPYFLFLSNRASRKIGGNCSTLTGATPAYAHLKHFMKLLSVTFLFLFLWCD